MFLLSKTESDQKVWKSDARRPTSYPKSVGLQKNTLGKALQWLKKLWCCSVEVLFRCNLVPLCEDNTGFVFTPNGVKALLPGCIGDKFKRTIKGAHSWEPIGITQGPPPHSRAFALEARRKNATFRNTGLRCLNAPGIKIGQLIQWKSKMYIWFVREAEPHKHNIQHTQLLYRDIMSRCIPLPVTGGLSRPG